MLTPTMTEQEELRELLLDYRDNVVRVLSATEPRLRRAALKATRFPVFVSKAYTSPRKNRWLVVQGAFSKKGYGGSAFVNVAAIIEADNGRFVLRPTFINERWFALILPAHLFSRYAERLGITLSGEDLILRFLKDTIKDFAWTAGENGGIIGACASGLLLGNVTDGDNILAKTFIPESLMRPEQREAWLGGNFYLDHLQD